MNLTKALLAFIVIAAVPATGCSSALEAEEASAPRGGAQQPDQSGDASIPAGEGQEPTGVAPVASGAANGTDKNPTRGHAWAVPVVEGDVVTIPVAVAASEDHVHFTVPGNDGDASFIGWLRDGTFNARATACPCCGTEAVEWGGTSLVCRACREVFDLETGAASDSCAYPEGTLPATVAAGVITMSLSNLVEAHERTSAGEDTLFEPEPEPEEEEPEVPACCRR